MKRTVLAGLALAALSCATPPSEPASSAYESAQRAHPYFAELDAAEAAGGQPAVNRLYGETAWDWEKLEAAALWFRDAYLRRPVHDPRYGLLYADLLLGMANAVGPDANAWATYMESGAITFHSSQLIAREDLARCAEKDVGIRYLENWTGKIEVAFRAYLAARAPEDRRRILDIATAFAARRATSPPDRAACGSGRKAMMQALEQGRCTELPPDPERPRHTEIACDAAEFAELVSDDVWSERRVEVRDRYVPWVLERIDAP